MKIQPLNQSVFKDYFCSELFVVVLGGVYPPNQAQGDIEFNNVTFAYPTRPTSTILDSLNVKVPAGSFTAVVGASGSGKSTIAALLLRLYDPTGGRVLVDGTPITDYNIEWLRKNIAYVSQVCTLLIQDVHCSVYGQSGKCWVFIFDAGKTGECIFFLIYFFFFWSHGKID